MIIDGKKISEEIIAGIKEKVLEENLDITLAIILVGDNEASKVYIKNKERSCEKAGIKTQIHKMDANTTKEELDIKINDLNSDDNINGVILQSPLPEHLDFTYHSNLINQNKDVDGLTTTSAVENYNNKEDAMLPCTVDGILKLLSTLEVDVTGMNVTIIGKSNLVGKPLFLSLISLGATCTLCHSKTVDIKEHTKDADIIVVAVGKPRLLKEQMVKDGAIVIDVGINRLEEGLVGDVDFDNLKDKCKYITPVPGGVGPMTVASIITNTLKCHQRTRKLENR